MGIDSVGSLDALVQKYLDDAEYHQRWQKDIQERAETLPIYRDLVQSFIAHTSSLTDLRDGFKRLHQDLTWGAKGPGFMMEFNRLVVHHLPTNPEIEANIRFILSDLTVDTLGEKIVQFHMLMMNEETRLNLLGNKKAHVAPGNSAFIISLLALWLAYPKEPYVYYWSLRAGLAALINTNFMPVPTELHIGSNGITITTSAEHQAVVHTLDTLGTMTPQLKDGPYWAERFMNWITEKLKERPDFLKNTLILIDDEGSNSDIDESSTFSVEVETFEDDWLQAIPEVALQQAIVEIRRRVLIDEELIRRIYRALLTGHVILTGPPGTGKTELARLLPELLWRDPDQERAAYATELVTATSDWSTRTLISGIIPIASKEKMIYRTRYGHLAQTILRNWSIDHNNDIGGRINIQIASYAEGQVAQMFRGLWLVIDEFNRAPIDTALGEALTALSNGGALQIPVDGTVMILPLPKDFRIIGTLNSFDRNYLNEISEALKRRFSFIEIPPPSRASRKDEQNIVLYKAMERCSHFQKEKLSKDEYGTITWKNPLYEDGTVRLSDVFYVEVNAAGVYHGVWDSSSIGLAFLVIFQQMLWPLIEVIRIYRQIGTAQIITLVTQLIAQCILQDYSEFPQWLSALDNALCDALADQLQILLPDQLDVLLWYLRLDADTFCQRYNDALASLKPRRQAAHLESLSMVLDAEGAPYLTDEEVEQLLALDDEAPYIEADRLRAIFHLERPLHNLPQFTRRLRTFKAERGL